MRPPGPKLQSWNLKAQKVKGLGFRETELGQQPRTHLLCSVLFGNLCQKYPLLPCMANSYASFKSAAFTSSEPLPLHPSPLPLPPPLPKAELVVPSFRHSLPCFSSPLKYFVHRTGTLHSHHLSEVHVECLGKGAYLVTFVPVFIQLLACYSKCGLMYVIHRCGLEMQD